MDMGWPWLGPGSLATAGHGLANGLAIGWPWGCHRLAMGLVMGWSWVGHGLVMGWSWCGHVLRGFVMGWFTVQVLRRPAAENSPPQQLGESQ